MASHMKGEEPTPTRVEASADDTGIINDVIDEGVRVEAQDVRSSRKYFYAPDRGKAARTKRSRSHHHRHHHRSSKRSVLRGCLIALLVVVAILAVCGGTAYAYGSKLYESARTVKSQASRALEQADSLTKDLTSGNYEAAQADAQQMADIAAQMKQELDSDLWRLAAQVPVYGGDVEKVQTLAIVFDDLANNAIIPLTQEMQGLDFKAIVGTEGQIDVNTLVGLANAVGTVSDTISRNANTVDALGEAKLEQVNEPLQRVRELLTTLDGLAQGGMKIAPYLPQMLGADGQTRNYLVVAQTNAEMRATGGFAGSCGMLYVTDGKLELGEFSSFVGLQRDEANWPELTEEEQAAFGDWMRNKFDNLNFSPNFVRVGALFAEMWQNVKGERVDGVVAIDPVFLQSVLALTGEVTTSNGWVVDGTNAAEYLLHTAYTDLATNPEQDAFFAEVAELSFKKFTSSIGDLGLTSVMSLISEAAETYRLQAWMANADEEAIIDEFGISGGLETDPAKPVLGVYVNDATWAKIGWYLDLRTTVDEGTINADGSITYQATTTVGNALTEYEATTLNTLITGNRSAAPCRGAMSTQVELFPPAGGSITDITVSDGSGTWYRPLYGFDVGFAHFWTEPESTTTITYTVTTSPEAREPLTIRMSPTARTFE